MASVTKEAEGQSDTSPMGGPHRAYAEKLAGGDKTTNGQGTLTQKVPEQEVHTRAVW